jgi:hypothetical protein
VLRRLLREWMGVAHYTKSETWAVFLKRPLRERHILLTELLDFTDTD